MPHLPGKATFWTTLISAAICLFHYLGYDHSHVVLYHISIPTWIIPLFADIQQVNKYLIYVLTVASWFAIGLGIDWLIAKNRRKAA